ncbi:Hsp70 family protein [Rhodoferax sp.]|uniref:Hsp70 family protein n=1 Tax=Rhodoferax sp. TaxID=50421 RepID=UPI002747CE02|nr:Hsp70 family protein [Rhodoferax sp.]
MLGIDFGTSNSAAAYVSANGTLCPIALEADRTTMPTALYFCAESAQVHYGSAALQAYLTATQDQIHGGRLMRAIKSLLGSRLMDERTVINGQLVSFFDIVVLFFKVLKVRSEQQLGHPVVDAMLGRPVHFVDDDPQRDAQAQATLARAAHAAGFESVYFQLEPIAAAFDFERRVERETTTLVVDIGGGTSDFTVIQLGPARRNDPERAHDVLATSGVHLGGTDFDRLLNLELVMPLLGLGHIGPSGRQVPSGIFHDLSTWHLIHHAYTRQRLHHAAELRTAYNSTLLHRRLMQVLQERQGHQLLAHVEAAKIACANSADAAGIDLACIERGLHADLTPQALRQTLQLQLDKIVQCARQCVASSGRRHIDAVYLTGGSSGLAPLVQALEQTFAGATMVHGDRFGGVAAGLAWAGSVAARQ